MVVIAAKGQKSVKKVDGRAMEVTPWCGADRPGEWSSFGVGLIMADRASLWGLAMPQMLVQSWRAMKLLELIPEIRNSTLCACWYAAAVDADNCDIRYLDSLAELFPNRRAFNTARNSILGLYPSPEELEQMMTNIKREGSQVDSFELTQLVAAGKIKHHPLIDELVEAEERSQREYQAKEDLINAPVAPEHSLGYFFTQLGIKQPVHVSSEGPYEITHLQLDAELKRAGFHQYAYDLYHRVAGGRNWRAEHPEIKVNGTRYTFLTATSTNDVVTLEVTVEKPDKAPLTKRFTLEELRPLVLKGKHRWTGILPGWLMQRY